jgi:Cdc6-like AAA superfamily ATPase
MCIRDRDNTLRLIFTEIHPNTLPKYLPQSQVKKAVQQIIQKQCTSMILVGPSGTGKSLLCKSISAKLNYNTLIFPSKTINRLNISQMKEIILLIKPKILLFDDLINENMGMNDSHLALLEYVNSLDIIVMATWMRNLPQEITDGSIGVPGLRPGRIDTTWLMYPPKDKLHKKILKYYLQSKPTQELIEATTRLTGAYLMQACKLYKLYPKTWKNEVRVLRATAASIEGEQND